MITEAADIEASRDEAQTEVVDIEEPSDCMTVEANDVEIFVVLLFAGVQHIESIFRDILKVSWAELCSLVEDKSYETLLAEEEGIMASFQTLKTFSRQDLSSQDEELTAVFSKARHVRDAQCSVVLPEVHDRLAAIRTASAESSSKLHHEIEAISNVHTTLQQFEERAARLRQKLTELDIYVENLRRKVTVRESVITGLEAEQAEFVLQTASLEESIEKGRESRVEQLDDSGRPLLRSSCFLAGDTYSTGFPVVFPQCLFIYEEVHSQVYDFFEGSSPLWVTSYMNSTFRLWRLKGFLDCSAGTSSSVMFTRNEEATLS
ncbi:hypothetical protein LIER_29454 [Lithospermum erythrorhizon]|uniref:Uncharacterized protein n=1 Tax=Lithospermum erythrorhizon TaxID=34254 RepID=A0AAV3RKT0_LITER